MSWKVITPRNLGLGLLFIFILGSSVYYLVVLGASKKGAEYVLNNQSTLLNANVENMESFLDSFGKALATRARQSSISEYGERNVQKGMDIFVEEWTDRELIGGIALVKEDGKVFMSSNSNGTKDIGLYLGDRDYFLWGKENYSKGGYFVGKPVKSRGSSSNGQFIIPVASVLGGASNTFTGIAVSSVRLEPLMRKFLEFMEVAENAHFHLVDVEGTIYYDKVNPDAIGSSILNRHSGMDSSRFEEALMDDKESQFVLALDNEGADGRKEHLFNFVPLSLGQQQMFLIMHTPYDAQQTVDLPLTNKIGIVIVLVVITAILFGAFGSRRTSRR